MESILGDFVLPLLLFIAGILNWSLISLIDLVASLRIRFAAPKRVMGLEWKVADAWWIKLIGLMTVQSWRSPFVIYFLVIQLLVAVIALTEIHWNKFGLFQSRDSCW